MFGRCISLILLMGLGTGILAQDDVAALEKKAAAASGKEKAAALNELANRYTYLSADKAIDYGQQALSAAKSSGSHEQEIRALNNIGWGHRVAGRMDQAREFYNKALPLAQELSDFKLIYNTTNNIGGTFEESGDFPKALEYYQQTFDLARKNNWEKGIAVSLSYQAIVYSQQHEYEQALKLYLEALAIQERIGATGEAADTLHNMGIIYMNQKNCQKALEMFQRALPKYEEEKDPRNIAIAENSMGCAYTCLKDLDNGVIHLQKALAMAEHIGFSSLVANSAGNLAIAYKDKGEFAKSLSYYEREKKFWESVKNKGGIAKVHLNMGETYLKMKDYAKAEENMLFSLKLARETDNRNQIKMNLTNLSELFKAKKDYQAALKYLEESVEVEKQLINTESAAKMAEMEAKYQAASRKRQIELLQNKNNIQKLQLSQARFRTIAFVLGTFLLLLLLLLLFRRYLHLLAFWKKKNYISHYKLDKLLGSGGMGVVWQAVDLMGEGKTVALKVIREELAGDALQRKRFLNEAYLVDQLNHPHIVKVFERGEHGQTLYIAMEMLKGKPLARVIGEGVKLPLENCIAIVEKMADALAQIHRLGILHRDVKPENIMLEENGTGGPQVKLLDFGLAQAPSLTRLTETGEILGTVCYLAPEVITQRRYSPASDIYSLGVVFYEMLTLEKPFFGDNPGQIIREILDKEPLAPSRFRSELPAELEGLVMRMLDKTPERRPSGEELRESLNATTFFSATDR